jgi:selenocysteine lyase/cysteine desulfurase
VFGSSDPARVEDRLGVISFALEGLPHARVAAILGFEAGIGVRDGCFCAHPYILTLLDVRGQEYEDFKREVIHHDRRRVPGLVRVSFGCYNTTDEVDYLVEWLERIRAGKYSGDYLQDPASGAYYPRGYQPETLAQSFDL